MKNKELRDELLNIRHLIKDLPIKSNKVDLMRDIKALDKRDLMSRTFENEKGYKQETQAPKQPLQAPQMKDKGEDLKEESETDGQEQEEGQVEERVEERGAPAFDFKSISSLQVESVESLNDKVEGQGVAVFSEKPQRQVKSVESLKNEIESDGLSKDLKIENLGVATPLENLGVATPLELARGGRGVPVSPPGGVRSIISPPNYITSKNSNPEIQTPPMEIETEKILGEKKCEISTENLETENLPQNAPNSDQYEQEDITDLEKTLDAITAHFEPKKDTVSEKDIRKLVKAVKAEQKESAKGDDLIRNINLDKNKRALANAQKAPRSFAADFDIACRAVAHDLRCGTNADMIKIALIKKGIKQGLMGKFIFWEHLIDRVYGKTEQKLQIESSLIDIIKNANRETNN